jgi:hypothetical protein
MADGDTTTPEPEPEPDDTSAVKPDDSSATPGKPGASSAATGKIMPGMTEQEIRDAGLAIDVPYESGQPEPERLRYADLGMPWTPPDGWPPETGQPQDEDDLNA